MLAVFVAYHCLWALGLESGTLENGEKVPTRTVVHGVARLRRHRCRRW